MFFFVSCNHGKIASIDTSIPFDSISKSMDISNLNSLISHDSSNPTLYYQRAHYFLNHHRLNEAMMDMSRVLKLDSTKPEYLITFSDIYFAGNHTGKSKDALEQCLKLDPANTKAMLKLAELFLYVKKHEQAIQMINQALKINNHLALGYYLKGLTYKDVGDTTKAISSFVTATEQNPDDYLSYSELGMLFAHRKNPLAIQYFNNAIRIEPRSEEIYYNRGKYYQDNQQWNLAKSDYLSLIRLNEGAVNAHYNLGAILLVENKLDSAQLEFAAALKNRPNYVEAVFAQGVCFKMKGKVNEAINEFKHALTLQPDFKPALEALNLKVPIHS